MPAVLWVSVKDGLAIRCIRLFLYRTIYAFILPKSTVRLALIVFLPLAFAGGLQPPAREKPHCDLDQLRSDCPRGLL